MNHSTDHQPPPLATATATAADDLAPPLQPQRLSTSSCALHPDENFSGFCPSCLCERLSVLDHTGAPPLPPSSSSSKISTASLKALFKPSTSSTRPGFFPELRRSKSFSAKNNEGFCNGFEPQRRSCDVTSSVRNVSTTSVKTEDEARKSSVSEAVVEVNEEETETECEITEEKSNEIVEEEEEEDELKPMKDYIDLYPQQTKKPSMKSFFSAASVFSKKLQKWKQKQRSKKQRKNSDLPEKKSDTQSEITDYTDPRFSLDAGRFSVDIGRISVDDEKPRASWDGHLISRPTATRVPPPPSMLSVPSRRSNMQDPVNSEPDPVITIIPGGSNQTRDYYNTEPPSRRRKSLDRSNSIKKIVASEVEEVKTVSNRKVSPVETEHINVGDKKSKRWKWSVFGFMYKKGGKEEEEDGYSRSNSTGVVERSLSESWPEMSNGGAKMRRSNSNVSWRSSGGGSGRNKEGENGMLRFYLTPMRRSWRKDGGDGGGRWEKTAANANSHGHSIAKRVMRLY